MNKYSTSDKKKHSANILQHAMWLKINEVSNIALQG